jgi:hypothetical protein
MSPKVTPSFLNDTESTLVVKQESLVQEENTMQDVHFVVRTITNGNFFGEGGEIPMAEFENLLRNDWLSKGWKVVNAFPVARGEGVFELAVALVKDVVL